MKNRLIGLIPKRLLAVVLLSCLIPFPGALAEEPTLDRQLVQVLTKGPTSGEKPIPQKGVVIGGRRYEWPPPLKSAVESGNIEMVKSFIAKGADVNQETRDGSTVLMWAVIPGNVEIIKLLLR